MRLEYPLGEVLLTRLQNRPRMPVSRVNPGTIVARTLQTYGIDVEHVAPMYVIPNCESFEPFIFAVAEAKARDRLFQAEQLLRNALAIQAQLRAERRLPPIRLTILDVGGERSTVSANAIQAATHILPIFNMGDASIEGLINIAADVRDQRAYAPDPARFARFLPAVPNMFEDDGDEECSAWIDRQVRPASPLPASRSSGVSTISRSRATSRAPTACRSWPLSTTRSSPPSRRSSNCCGRSCRRWRRWRHEPGQQQHRPRHTAAASRPLRGRGPRRGLRARAGRSPARGAAERPAGGRPDRPPDAQSWREIPVGLGGHGRFHQSVLAVKPSRIWVDADLYVFGEHQEEEPDEDTMRAMIASFEGRQIIGEAGTVEQHTWAPLLLVNRPNPDFPDQDLMLVRGLDALRVAKAVRWPSIEAIIYPDMEDDAIRSIGLHLSFRESRPPVWEALRHVFPLLEAAAHFSARRGRPRAGEEQVTDESLAAMIGCDRTYVGRMRRVWLSPSLRRLVAHRQLSLRVALRSVDILGRHPELQEDRRRLHRRARARLRCRPRRT
jgi:hypothetical protein